MFSLFSNGQTGRGHGLNLTPRDETLLAQPLKTIYAARSHHPTGKSRTV